jgi:hypothetical protein
MNPTTISPSHPSAVAVAPIPPHLHEYARVRILSIKHAMVCRSPAWLDARCPGHPNCHYLKNMWDHLSICHDDHCNARHCVSTRRALAHYRACTAIDCPVCIPIKQSFSSYTAETTVQLRQPRRNRSPSVVIAAAVEPLSKKRRVSFHLLA